MMFMFYLSLGEKQIKSLKEQNHRCHMEEMLAELKMEQMKKLTNNECEKVYSLAQQRDEITSVRFSMIKIINLPQNQQQQ